MDLRVPAAVAGTVLWAVLAGCGGGQDEATVDEVAACDDLARRENELIAVINAALADLADATDDRERIAAIADGFDALVRTATGQRVGEVEDALRRPLVDGAEAAVAELEDERDRVLRRYADGVSLADERGVAGELQNALEKAFSLLEPARSAYRDAGLAEATDTDPDCRFVTQRADPSA